MKSIYLPFTLGISLAVGSFAHAALIYEGFEATPGGSVTAYNSSVSIIGQGPARTGFTGVYSQSGGLAPGTVDFQARDVGLTYPATNTGGSGLLEFFRIASSSSVGDKVANRSLSYTAPETSDIYFSFQLSYTGSLPATVSFVSNLNERNFAFDLSSTGLLTLEPGGSSATTYSEQLTAGATSLIVVKAVNDESGTAPGSNPNTAFYDYLEFYVNPTIIGASLGTPDATGFGIVRNLGGGGTAVAYDGFRLAGNAAAGTSVRVDEVYITTDLNDIVAVPEPGTVALFLVGGIGLIALQRRRRRNV